MDLIAAVVGGALGVVGAFVGVWLANFYDQRARKEQQQKDITVGLFNEFKSPEMLNSRIKATRILRANEQKSIHYRTENLFCLNVPSSEEHFRSNVP